MEESERLRFHVVYNHDPAKDRWWRCPARSYEPAGPGDPLGAQGPMPGVHHVQVFVIVERAEGEDDNHLVQRAGHEADAAFRRWDHPDHLLDDPAERIEPKR